MRMGPFQDGILFFLCIKMHCHIFSEDYSVYRLYMLRVTAALSQNKDYMTENVFFLLVKNQHPLKAASLQHGGDITGGRGK